MKPFKIKLYFYLLLALSPLNAYAQQAAYVGDDDVSNVFISGGYGALFGAATGAAMLPFINGSASQNIRIVAGGASIGFMVGSVYGFYSLAKSNKNSYFNYNINQDDDNSYYYSMPATLPTQGNNKKNHRQKQNIQNINEERMTPIVGALFMGDKNKVDMAIPYFWIQDKQVNVMLAYLTF
ncbi:MAG: hypothetical protein V4591_00070 [Bdellovibrionota bacterium]